MDLFPFDLVLAVAVASATIFLGFLSTRNIVSSFFALETLKAALAWLVVALVAPLAIFHYYFILAVLCFVAWWQFHEDHAFNGKMWLYVAAALGISAGVMFLLAVTPRAYPATPLLTIHDLLLLAAIYLGGAVTGLAYVGCVLVRSSLTHAGFTREMVRGYAWLLLVLVLARAAVLLALYSSRHLSTPRLAIMQGHDAYDPVSPMQVKIGAEAVLGVIGVVLPVLAFTAYRIAREQNQGRAAAIMAAIAILALAAEMLSRMFAI